jgi:hypothetical protein
MVGLIMAQISNSLLEILTSGGKVRRPLDVFICVTDLASSSRFLTCVLYSTIKGGLESLLPVVHHLLDTTEVTHRYTAGGRKEMSVPSSCTSITELIL